MPSMNHTTTVQPVSYTHLVPTLNVSVADLTFNAKRPTTVEEVNKIILEASESPELKGILGYNELPLVSSDFNHTSCLLYTSRCV